MLQPAISAASLDLKDDLLDGAQTGLVGVDNLRLPPLALGVPRVGLEQVGGEQAGLVAAGAGPDLHDHVLGVVGIAGHQGELQVERDPGLCAPPGLSSPLWRGPPAPDRTRRGASCGRPRSPPSALVAPVRGTRGSSGRACSPHQLLDPGVIRRDLRVPPGAGRSPRNAVQGQRAYLSYRSHTTPPEGRFGSGRRVLWCPLRVLHLLVRVPPGAGNLSF